MRENKEKITSNAEELLETSIIKAISELDNRITTIEKDSLKRINWIAQRLNIMETVRIQSTITKMIEYILNVNKNIEETLLYKKTKKLYDRCDKLLAILDN